MPKDKVFSRLFLAPLAIVGVVAVELVVLSITVREIIGIGGNRR